VLHKPRILFLDEPTSGVDPISRRQFWDLIHQMADEGVTVFVTTHYMEEAEYCNRLALIFRARWWLSARPSELKRDSMKGDLLLIECEPLGKALSSAIAPDVMDAAVFGNALHLVVLDAAAAIPRVEKYLADQGVAVNRNRADTSQPGRCVCFSDNGKQCWRGAQSMSLRRLFAVARKEVIQILRDSRSLMIVVIMPVTLMLLFRLRASISISRGCRFMYSIATEASKARTC